MKYPFLLLLATLLLGRAEAQSKPVDDAAHRPDRKEQSGKADLYVHDKTRISDDSLQKAPRKPAARKKKGCSRRHNP